MDGDQGVTSNSFKSPLATLLSSLSDDHDITQHDISQAYALFYTRIKSLATLNGLADAPLSPDLLHLRSHAPELALCLKRDVERALQDTGSTVRYLAAVSEDKYRYLRQEAQVAQNAIRVASALFGSASLSSLFLVRDLEVMLDAVLAVLQVSVVLTPGESKTRSLALYALTALHIPEAIARKKQQVLVNVVAANMACDGPLPQDERMIADSLKALHNLLSAHAFIFLSPALKLFEQVLSFLVSRSLLVRLGAGSALVGYAHAVVLSYKVEAPGFTSPSEYEQLRSTIWRRTLRFIQAQEIQRKKDNNKNVTKLGLLDLLLAEIPLAPDTKPGPNVGWAFSMLACLTILVGPAALTEPDHLKLIVKTIPVVAVAHPWKPQACLHGIVWRCLIWNFSLTPYMPRSKAMEGDHDWRNVLRQRATDDIKQAQVEGVGAWLVCALLGKNEKPFAPALANRLPRNADVVRTINVLRGLLEHPHRRLFSEGVAVLGRLTSDVGDETSRRELLSVWDSAAVLPQELLDGTIVEAELRHLAGLEKRVKPFHVGSIRSLCRAEVEEHWEQLLEVWVLAARRVFTDDRVLHLMSDILHVWQTLLLAQAQLTPSYDHLTFTPDYSSRVLSIVKDFLAWDIHRFVQLGSAKQLWMVMKRVFAVPWLQDAAESILRVLLSSRGSDEPGDTLEAYRELCIDLSFSGKPDMLGSIAATSEDVVLSHKAGELWFSVAPLWTLRNPTPAWQSTAVFLSVPWKFATPADAQRTIWTNLFSFAVLCAGETGYSVNSVLEELSRHFSTVTADLLLCLLSYMRFNDGITIPLTLLQRVDDYIRLYPIQSQDIYPAINVIDALSQSISTCSAGSIVPVLRSLQAGMRLWIQTGPDLVSDDEYDQHIMGFYCNSLDSLYRAVDSVQVLRDLEEYLCAPFENIRKEAIGPLTFKSFWDRISSRLDLDNDNGEQLPEKLKTSLCAIYDAYGGDRPAYLPKDSQSQDVSVVIPDSQPEGDEQSFEMWYRQTASTGNAVGEKETGDLRDGVTAQQHATSHIGEVGRVIDGHESQAPVSSSEVPIPITTLRTKTADGNHELEQDRGEGSSTSVLGKRIAVASSKTKRDHRAKRTRSGEQVPASGAEPDTTVRVTRSMKRRMSAHDDRSDVSEHADVSGPMSVPPSTSRTERHVLSMHENRTQQSDDSRLGALRGSLPSPPLCEEVPFMVAGCDYAEQSCEVLGAAERDNLRISGQELTLPMRTDGSPGQSSVISRDDTSSHAAHSAHSAGRQGLEPTFVHMLRSTHAVMRQGLAESKVSADDVIAAQELLQSMGTMITEKLRSRIRPRAGVK